MKKLNVKEIALIGILGGLAGLLMLFKFPLPFMPPFMDFDFASVPELIGGFALGPVAAVMIVLVKILVKLVLMGTSTMLTGELSNVLLSIAYVIPAVLIYDHLKSKRSAEKGMVIGTISCSLMAVLTNLTFIIPFYVSLFNMSMDQIIAMCSQVNPLINNVVTMAIIGIVPFNLIKCGVSSIITLLVYKKLSPMMKNFIRR